MINSVEVIHQHEEGPDVYRVGSKLHPEGTVIHRIDARISTDKIQNDIVRIDHVFTFFDEASQMIMRIENCPVVVRYKPE